MGSKLVTLDEKKLPRNMAFSQCGTGQPQGQVIEVLDTSDPNITMMEGRIYRPGPGICRSDYRVFVRRSFNAVDQVVHKVERAAKRWGKIQLLRFHGHGVPGYQSIWGEALMPSLLGGRISEERANRLIKYPNSRVAISYWNLRHISASLMRLTPHFAPGGEVWLMGCNVGGKHEGRQLVDALAKYWGVIVRAGIDLQFANETFANRNMNYLHEGPVAVGRPIVDPWAR